MNANSLKNLTYRISKGSTPWNKGIKKTEKELDELRKNQSIKICEICSSIYRIKKSHANKRRTCSLICGATLKSLEKSGKNHPMYGREGKRGSSNTNWKGGVTPINNKIRSSVEYRLWSHSVMSKDNFTCQKTGIRGGKIVAHHILNFSSHPELRFAIDNGITLSRESHNEFHKLYGKKNNSREQLIEFLNKNI